MTDPADLIQGWFAVEELEPGIFVIAEPLHLEEVNSFLVVGDERAIVIDTGMGIGDFRAVVDALTDRPVQVVNTHAHWDHIGANWRFDEIAIHEAEADDLPRGVALGSLVGALADEELRGPLPDGTDVTNFRIRPSRATTILHGGEAIDLGGRQLEVIHAPGHSPGGIVLLDRANGLLFSTDVAYPGPLYAFGDDTDFDVYRETLQMLADLAPSLRIVFPSHNGTTMSPDVLTAMPGALAAIAAGRAPELVKPQYARHEFDGFAVLAPLAYARGDR